MSDVPDLRRHVLRDGGVSVTILNLGCITQDWRVPLGDTCIPVVLGYADPADYLARPGSFGAIVGRVANRISGAGFTLDGQGFDLPANEPPNHLHGGPGGIQTRFWDSEPQGDRAVQLRLVSEDGDQGYPGRVEYSVTITLDGHEVTYDMCAESDRPTPVNLAQHSYYNLMGRGAVWDHNVTLAAASFTPADAAMIPTGEVAATEGRDIDLQATKSMRQADPQMRGLDLNYVLDGDAEKPAAQVTAPNGMKLTLWTDQPCLQLYSAGNLRGAGQPHPGQSVAPFAGLCLEPQGYPNAVNTPAFPPVIITPERPYRQRTRIRIAALAAAVLLAAGWSDGALAETPPVSPAEPVFAEPDLASVRLGRLLFYDPILSGGGTVSCATCHHPKFNTSDGLSLGMGEGGLGLGPARVPDPDNSPEQRIPRNAPALFNLGAAEFTTLFHDGRLQADPSRPSGIRTPLGAEMEQGFSGVLAAQAMFPVLSGDEMAGHYSENDVAQAVRQGFITGPDGAWAILAARVEAIPAYRDAFDTVIGRRDITFADIANSIADFVNLEWRADGSPFDLYLRAGTPLPEAAARGMDLFYGRAGCSACHAGRFQTDHGFHAIAMPQIGPGKAARFERHHRDVGRMRVTGAAEDAYRFRTPSLRNVAETAPYGHSGVYATLEGVVRHHLDPVASLMAYEPAQAVLAGPRFDSDFAVTRDAAEMAAIAAANELAPTELTDAEVADLLAFLKALTDPESLKGVLGVPKKVPSGLVVER